MAQYLDSMMDGYGLVKDIDFEIVSMLVMDYEYNVHSLGGFLGRRSNQLIEGNTDFLEQAKGLIKVYGRENDVLWVAPTQYKGGDNVKFYKLKCDIDIDLATEVGLGVVLFQGDMMIYSNQPNNDPIDAVYEMIKLKVYLQLMHDENVDMKLKESFDKQAELIQSLILINHRRHMERLEVIFEKKGGTKPSEEKSEKPRLNRTERITSGDILYILAFLYGRQVERHEALTFLKKVEGCILDDVENSSKKAIYTASKDNFFTYVKSNPKYTKLLENRGIENYQMLDDYASQYVIEHF